LKSLSNPLAELLGEERLARTEVVKRLIQYIKDNKLQHPKDKRKILFDDRLQHIFKRKTTTFFKLQSLLSKHVFDPDEIL